MMSTIACSVDLNINKAVVLAPQWNRTGLAHHWTLNGPDTNVRYKYMISNNEIHPNPPHDPFRHLKLGIVVGLPN